MRWSRLLVLIGLLAACTGPTRPAAFPTPEVARVGERAEVAEIRLTVNSVERKNQIGENSEPGPGNEFVVVEVTIDNASEYKVPYSPYQFSLTDSTGRQYPPTAVPGQEKPLVSSELDAKKDVTGAVVFRAPVQASGLELAYRAPGARAPIRVNLSS